MCDLSSVGHRDCDLGDEVQNKSVKSTDMVGSLRRHYSGDSEDCNGWGKAKGSDENKRRYRHEMMMVER